MSWNPVDWAGAAWRWTTGSGSSEAARQRARARLREAATARPSNPVVTDTSSPATPPHRAKYRPSEARVAKPDDVMLARARKWLHGRVKDHSSDIAALLADEDGVRQLMQPFWDDLVESERSLLKTELLDQGFPGTTTQKMLVSWATARLRVRLTEQLRTAAWGPRTQIVSGGLPGSGKRS